MSYKSYSKSSSSQEEKHIKLLKDMMRKECNKNCFECNQRGPTYVDITIGSFVCTSCGGILRGLNKPHRVKSVSMASFTATEIAFIETKGNDYCKATYLGKFDEKTKMPDFKDTVKMKMFMEQKYDKKKWYVSPQEVNKPLDSFKKSVEKKPEQKPASNLISNVNTAPVSAKQQKPSDGSSLNAGNLVNVPAATKADNPDLGFADFSQAFSSQPFDPFGSFTSGQSSATSANSALTAASFGDNFSKGLTLSSTSITEDLHTTKSADKYSDLGDLFKVDSSASEKSNNIWGDFDKSSTNEMNSTSGFSVPQQQATVPGSNNWQAASTFNNNTSMNSIFSSNFNQQPSMAFSGVQQQTGISTAANSVSAGFGTVSQPMFALSTASGATQPSFPTAAPAFGVQPAANTMNNQNFFQSFGSGMQNAGSIPTAASQFQVSQPFANTANSFQSSASANPFGFPNAQQSQVNPTNPFMIPTSASNAGLLQPSSTNPFASQTNFPTNQNQFPTNQNQFPTNQNQFSTNQNQFPTNQNQLLTNQNQLSTNPFF